MQSHNSDTVEVMERKHPRVKNLTALIKNGYRICDWPEWLPKYASIVGDPERPFHAPQEVVLHDTTDRPCPESWSWMACFDLDTGDRQ